MASRRLLAVGALLPLLLPPTLSSAEVARVQARFMPLSTTYNRAADIAYFEATATYWGYEPTYALQNPEDIPDYGIQEGYDIEAWCSDLTGSRLVWQSTHGSTGGPAVIYFPDEDAAGLYYDLWTNPPVGAPVYSPDEIGYGRAGVLNWGTIILKPAGIARLCSDMERTTSGGPRGIAVMSWCRSATSSVSAYFAKGAGAAFVVEGETDCTQESRKIVGSLGCADWHGGNLGEDGTVCDVRWPSSDMHLYTNPAVPLCSSNQNSLRLAYTRDCANVAAQWMSVGKFGSTVYWKVVEYGTTAYYILGFREKKHEPDYVRRVDPAPEGGRGREVLYEASVPEDLPYWEVVETDDDPETRHGYSGFFEAGQRPAEYDEWLRAPIVRSLEELYGEVAFQTKSESRVFDDARRTWVPLSELGASPGSSEAESGEGFLRPLSGPTSDCDSGTPTQPPDTVLCADWLVVSSEQAFADTAYARQNRYLGGRTVKATVNLASFIEDTRAILRITICRNIKWNLWAAANGHPRRFKEQCVLVLVGSPGEVDQETGNIVNIIVPYASISSASTLLCTPSTPCLVDGQIACPWLSSPDSICVPYTRIPASTIDEVRSSYDMAEKYSHMEDIDPERQTTFVAGDYPSTTVPTGPCPYGFIDEDPVNYLQLWGQYLEGPSGDVIRQTQCDRRERLIDRMNEGCWLAVGMGYSSSNSGWPGFAWTDPGNYERQQLVVAIEPTCKTMLAVRRYGGSADSYACKFHFADPGKTRMVFGVGITTNSYYIQDKEFGLCVLKKIDEYRHSSEMTWQEVILKAQEEYVQQYGDWETMLRVSSIGAPVRMPSGLTSSVLGDGIEKADASVQVWPNPSWGAGTCAVGFYLRDPGRVSIEVYDVAGRRIALIAGSTLEAGRQVVPWDGRDDSGRVVGSGIYFVKVSTPGGKGVGRLVKVK